MLSPTHEKFGSGDRFSSKMGKRRVAGIGPIGGGSVSSRAAAEHTAAARRTAAQTSRAHLINVAVVKCCVLLPLISATAIEFLPLLLGVVNFAPILCNIAGWTKFNLEAAEAALL